MPMAAGMEQAGGTGAIFFVNTGTAATATTWLWTAQGTGGAIGTWRTETGGAAWVRVDSNEHPHGLMQIYQSDASGLIYMAGIYSRLGWGDLRSTDYGRSWVHQGKRSAQSVVFGTPNPVCAAYSWACGGCAINPDMQVHTIHGLAGWEPIPTPAAMTIGPAQTVTVFDGTRYIIVTANWRAGRWRYVE